MQNQLLRDEPENASLREAAGASVQELLRHLAVQITHGPTPTGASDSAGQTPEVVLELDIAGIRYLLLRSWRPSPAAPALLSRREEEIARLIAQGYANKTIAAELDISPWTVCTYIRRIFAKIGVVSRAQMVARLLEHGTIKEPPSPAPALPLPAGMPEQQLLQRWLHGAG